MLPATHARGLFSYRPAPDAGLVLEPRTEGVPGEPLCEVEGTGDWAVVERSSMPQHLQVLSLGNLARFPPSAGVVGELPQSEEFKRPYHALLAPLADGGTELLVSAFDALLAADVTRLVSGGVDMPPASVDVKAVPLSRSPILSMAAIPPRAGEIASGYVLTRSSLFRFGAQSHRGGAWRRSPCRGTTGRRSGGRRARARGVPGRRHLRAAQPGADLPAAAGDRPARPGPQLRAGLRPAVRAHRAGVPDAARAGRVRSGRELASGTAHRVVSGAPSDYRLHTSGSTLYVVDGYLTVGAFQVPCAR